MVTTIFNLTNAEGESTYTTLNISPVYGGFNYSGSIISNQTVVIENFNGTAEVPLVPTAYEVRALGYTGGTMFNMDLSTVTDGSTVLAGNYIVGQVIDSNFTASYAFSAATASYALYAANGGGSVPTGSSQVLIGSIDNPNGIYTPVNTASAAMYYMDDPGLVVIWFWSIVSQTWIQATGF